VMGRTLQGLAVGGFALTLIGVSGSAGASGSAPVAVRVNLTHHRAVAGDPIAATVVLTNTTEHRIVVNQCAINGWLAVGLENKVIPYDAYFSEVECAPTVYLRPGPNRFHVTVSTRYPGCTTNIHQVLPQSMPSCTASGASPALPAGRYSTTVDIMGLTTQTPRRVNVTLLSRSERRKAP
jgi:hypothetical protein